MKFAASADSSALIYEALAMQFAMPIQQELGLGIAMFLTFLGMVLHWQTPRQRMAMEERMKDGKLTEMQARRRMRIFHWSAPAVTLTGIALLLGTMLAFAE
jgi:hypothetical protein